MKSILDSFRDRRLVRVQEDSRHQILEIEIEEMILGRRVLPEDVAPLPLPEKPAHFLSNSGRRAMVRWTNYRGYFVLEESMVYKHADDDETDEGAVARLDHSSLMRLLRERSIIAVWDQQPVYSWYIFTLDQTLEVLSPVPPEIIETAE